MTNTTAMPGRKRSKILSQRISPFYRHNIHADADTCKDWAEHAETLEAQLDHMSGRVEALTDQLSGTAQRAKDFEVKAAELQQHIIDSEAHANSEYHKLDSKLADMTTHRDQLLEVVGAVRQERDKAREDRDRNAQEAAGLRAELHTAYQHSARQQGGTGTGTAIVGVAPNASHTGGSSSVGCSSGISASTAPSLQELASQVLQESLTNGRWIEYPELREFVLNRFKD